MFQCALLGSDLYILLNLLITDFARCTFRHYPTRKGRSLLRNLNAGALTCFVSSSLRPSRLHSSCLLSSLSRVPASTFSLYLFFNIASSSPYFHLYPPYQDHDITSEDYWAFLATLLWTSVISLSLGVLWMGVAHLAPYQAPKICWFLTALVLLVVAVLSLVLNLG